MVSVVIISLWCTTIVFFIGRFACPRRDRVPLLEVDHVLPWTTLRRGWYALTTFGPGPAPTDHCPEGDYA